MESKTTRYLTISTIMFSVLPFLVYCFEVSKNILPDPDIWYGANNHGPWREGSWEGLILLKPLVFLILITFVFLIKRIIKTEQVSKKKEIIFFVGLILVQIIMLFLQLFVMAWTID